MDVLFSNDLPTAPQVSIVLLDWSCRESFHSLQYLNQQTMPRDQYELLWIEYYGRRPVGISALLQGCNDSGVAPVVDKWIVLDMPHETCYHKHLPYNVGILAGRGGIVVFCDSDAIFTPTFVESIVEQFRRDSNIVLHIDEIRNEDRRFYPFSYPTVDDITGKGCINFKDGRSTGLQDDQDPLHTLNYGACMCARRSDLIGIGGADEHMDYFGHVCGPYEMTFRLVNTGKREVWHQGEFIYHVWHPGTDGTGNYIGPHDGRNVSTTALEARRTGRVMPLIENPLIKTQRLGNDNTAVTLPLTPDYKQNIGHWTVSQLNELSKKQKIQWKKENKLNNPTLLIKVKFNLAMTTIRQFIIKANKFIRHPNDVFRKLYKIRGFFQTMASQNEHNLQRAFSCLNTLKAHNVSEFAIYAPNAAAEVLCNVAGSASLMATAIYDDIGGAVFCGLTVMAVESAPGRGEVIVIADVGPKREKLETLKRIGVNEDRIIVL
ncbi:Glycosyl transferase, family 2 domain protein [Candidatus Magnetobacterium bavaricum]|uniref:Glycosyl transferase, family 2 domain protein n=1 Tax=Candidatus Magnetobacterium bavaricum TaxID=29290 RepID=A0A0F3GW28_9BACT|nr:Glycosyl transferase, family 2 domain protein [Candidatus Magnetobacterium bavaricum]